MGITWHVILNLRNVAVRLLSYPRNRIGRKLRISLNIRMCRYLLPMLAVLLLIRALHTAPVDSDRDNLTTEVNTTSFCQPDFEAGYPWATPDGMIWYSFKQGHTGTWRQMEEYCRRIEPGRTTMAMVTNAKEQHFTEQLIRSKGSAWIGAGRFVKDLIYWYTNLHHRQILHSMPYTNWESGQPNNFSNDQDCVYMADGDGTWNDDSCTDSLS